MSLRACDSLPERFNAAEWFVARHVREGRGERTAVVWDGGALDYAALDEAVRRRAAALLEAGLHPGDRVALLLPDGPELLALFWASLAAGGVAVPLNTLLHEDEVRAILDDCDPRARGGRSGAGRPRAPGAPGDRRVASRPGAGESRSGPAGRGLLGHPPGRLRLLPILERHDGRAQGRGPPAPRHVGVLRDLRGARAGDSAGGPLPEPGQAVLRLRARERRLLPAPTWARLGAVPGSADARGHVRRRSPATGPRCSSPSPRPTPRCWTPWSGARTRTSPASGCA